VSDQPWWAIVLFVVAGFAAVTVTFGIWYAVIGSIVVGVALAVGWLVSRRTHETTR
jgi:predicted membrane protein